MVQLLSYGNTVFWIGMLLACFLAGCDFFCNNTILRPEEYKFLRFKHRPALQKNCRIVFLISLFLTLFSKFGADWQEHSYSLEDHFTRVMNIWLIYYVVCYTLVVIVLCWLKVTFKLIIWLYHAIREWIND